LQEKAHFRNLTMYNVTQSSQYYIKNDFAKVSKNLGKYKS